MQKLNMALIGLSLSMGVAEMAVAQSAQPGGQMPTAPGTSGDSSTMAPNGSAPGSTPAPSTMPGDTSTSNGTAAPGMPSAGGSAPDGMSSGTGSAGAMAAPPAANQSYPRCSATVHDECRQRN